MLRWIILLIVLYLAYKLLKGYLFPPKIARRDPPKEINDEMVQDPVCQVYIPKRQAVALSDPNGTIHYFCSTKCRDAYSKKTAQRASTKGK
jgi:YHS domain-containing protein